MNYYTLLIGIAVLTCTLFDLSCNSPSIKAQVHEQRFENIPDHKVKGMTVVAPPNPFGENPFEDLLSLGINWIVVNPFAFLQPKNASLVYDSKRQWWGERPEGIYESARMAKAQGMKVMLKPQVWSHRMWSGDLSFSTEEEWKSWEGDYREYILKMAEIADSANIDLFCIGNEFKPFVQQRPQFWEALIEDVRLRYNGQLTYAANWDEYQLVPFWHKLDYIGVNAYFPLDSSATPRVTTLCESWKPIKKSLKQVADKHNKPLLFTEFGYLSVDGCAHETWKLEARRNTLNPNQQAQANALESIFMTFGNERWWKGGFQWKWYPNELGNNGEGHMAKDYTPQGKKAENVLVKWYK